MLNPIPHTGSGIYSAFTAPQSLCKSTGVISSPSSALWLGSYLHVEEHQPHSEVAEPVHRAPHHEGRGPGRLQEHFCDHHGRNGTCEGSSS